MEGAARADLGQSLTLLVAEVAAEQQLQLDGGDFPLSRIAGEARLDPVERPTLAFGPSPWAVLGVVGARLRREVGAVLTLLDSRAASKEGSCMDPGRLPHTPHPLAPDSQTACESTR